MSSLVQIPVEKLSLASRLFAATAIRGIDECWIFQGYLNGGGYGQMHINGKSGDVVGAHRVSYGIFNDDLDNRHVLHKCDTPACVNPRHLSLGTHAENMADCAAKGRNRATRNGGHKQRLTSGQSDQLIALRDAGMNFTQLGKMFDMSAPGVRYHYKAYKNAQ